MTEPESNFARPLTQGGPLFITADNVDPDLCEPFVDIDEARTIVVPLTGARVACQYVHGGFTATNVRFSLYFPDPADYRGRFFQSTYPLVTDEDAAPDTLGFALAHGAFVVSTNNGGGIQAAGAIAGYRINAAAAKFSRVLAASMYGPDAPTRGYIHGASGGAYQTLGALENTSGVWAGGVPIVPGPPNSIPSFMASAVMARRVLRHRLGAIVDALEPGGSGDPYAGLSDEESAALSEVTRLGFPLRGWWQYETLDGGAFPIVNGGVRMVDPTYVDDFWTAAGYAGTDPTVSVGADRLQLDARVVSLETSGGLTVSNVPSGELSFADLVITSGASAGVSLPIQSIDGFTVRFGHGSNPTALDAVQPGDLVRIDNSWSLALQYYHRHQVPPPDQYGWNQFRGADGTPSYPQRAFLCGPMFAAGTSGGAAANGRFYGKMIMLASLLDVQAYPWAADWYRNMAAKHRGGLLDDDFRLWFTDNADHDASPAVVAASALSRTHTVTYLGVLEQALLDLDEWVTTGVAPPATTGYHVDENNQVVVAANLDGRFGVQPTVIVSVARRSAPGSASVAADGTDVVITVGAGTAVDLTVEAVVPPGAGAIVQVEWDIDGSGTFPVSIRPDPPAPSIRVTHACTFDQPGTYFAVARVTSQRLADADAPYGRIQNLARARIVVTKLTTRGR